MQDGIHGLLPREQMAEGTRKLRDFYDGKPGAPLVLKEFGYYSLDRWISEGHIKSWSEVEGDYDAYLREVFGFDEPGQFDIWNLGWCEAAFSPFFEEKVIEDRGDHEVAQDFAGRHVLFFKDRRSGYMPEYLSHPVKDMKTWQEDVKWRLDPKTPARVQQNAEMMKEAAWNARQGKVISQRIIGGYMYLRSLMGPEDLCYLFYDEPELIHDCMQTWLELADSVTAQIQQAVSYDEVFLAEDICYNHGPLISPDMMQEFLFPYYQQLIHNIRGRQLDKNRRLNIQVDTDGFCWPVIDMYREAIGMNFMSPFEAAAGSDIVASGEKWPDLLLSGGIDKRILATTPEEIDRYLDGILPVLHRRGGYIPTCDHGVPEEVSFENYLHFRRRVAEYA